MSADEFETLGGRVLGVVVVLAYIVLVAGLARGWF